MEKPGCGREAHAGQAHEPVNKGKPAAERVHAGQHDDRTGQKSDHGKYEMPGEKRIKVLPFPLGNMHVQLWRHGIEPGIGHAEYSHPQGDAETNLPSLDRTVELEHYWCIYLKNNIARRPAKGVPPQKTEELLFPGVRVSPGHSDQAEKEPAIASQDDTGTKDHASQNGNPKSVQPPPESQGSPKERGGYNSHEEPYFLDRPDRVAALDEVEKGAR